MVWTMTTYFVCYLDAMGRTLTEERTTFENRAAALAFARRVQPNHAITKIWRKDELLIRLYRRPKAKLDQQRLDPEARASDALSRADAAPLEQIPSETSEEITAAKIAQPDKSSEPDKSPFLVSHIDNAWGPMPPPRFIPDETE